MATLKGKIRTKEGDILYPQTSADKVDGLASVATSGSYNDLTNKPTIDTAVNTTSTNAVENQAISNYIAARGENLLTNGTALLGNNYNFSPFTFEGIDTYYAGGCFTKTGSVRYTVTTDEFMPVDVNNTYEVVEYAKCTNTSSRLYTFLDMYDIDKKSIIDNNVMFITGSTTTLAQELKNGDTKVYLTDVSGFNKDLTQSYQRGLIFWNYQNSYGYQYDVETYSRNLWHDLWADGTSIDTTNNTITLKTAWTRGTFPAGTSVSQTTKGINYIYIGSPSAQTATDTVWKKISGTISGVGLNNAGGKFRPGTAFVKLGWYINDGAFANTTWKLSTLSVARQFPIVNNATLTITQNGTTKGTFSANASSANTIELSDTTYESKTATSGGTDVSLVTTGEKYTWNNKSDFSGSYSDLSNKPTFKTLNTDNSATQTVSSSESLTGSDSIKLHKVAKTGYFNDLLDKYDSYLKWGGSLSGNAGPVDVAINPQFNPNRIAFMRPQDISLEYSRDGGETWTDYNVSDTDKIKLVSGLGTANYYCGGTSSDPATNYQLRVTLTAATSYLYFRIRKIHLNISENGCTGNKVTMSGQYVGSENFTTLGTYNIGGYPGWSTISYTAAFGSFNTTQTTNIKKLRFTFHYTNKNSTNAQLSFIQIMIFGEAIWSSTNNMQKIGTIYSYDTNQNVLFPANIKVNKTSLVNTASGSIDLNLPSGAGTLARTSDIGAMLKTISGYDATKTQILKNTNGTLQWVTPTHETWTFTLDDNTTVTKEIMLWD